MTGQGRPLALSDRYPDATQLAETRKSCETSAEPGRFGTEGSESVSRRSPGGGGFKSSRPDQFSKKIAKFSPPGHSVLLPDSSPGTE
jgi:hypothetical protein